MGALVAVLNKKGENGARTAVAMLEALSLQRIEYYGISSAKCLETSRTLETLKTTKIDSSAIVGHAFAKILKKDKPQFVMLKKGAFVFEGRIYSQSTPQSLMPKRRCNLELAARDFLRHADGEYAFAIALPEEIVAGRDPLGVRPLYFGENINLIALATERKALWKVGIKKVYSFPPGKTCTFNSSIVSFKNARIIARPRKPLHLSIEKAQLHLLKLLGRSIKKRISGTKEIAVAFSGGLDSSVISSLAKKCGATIQLIYVSLNGQKEIDYARQIAAELGLPIQVCLHDEDSVETIVSKVIWLVEEADPIKIGIAVPFFWAAEKAAQMGLKIMLAGQGADELFGGYQRYVDDYVHNGIEKAEEAMLEDILAMHKTNLERDFKICNFHNVELRLPFADFQIASFALSLPIEFKMERSENTLRKLILRKAAHSLGLSKTVVYRPKKAIQYTTGVNDALKRLAKKRGLPVSLYLQEMSRFSFRMTRDD